MEPDPECMSLQQLYLLNNNLERLKCDAVIKLHGLQKVKHDLLTENARLIQRTREYARQKRENGQKQLGRNHATQLPAQFGATTFNEQMNPGALKGVYTPAHKNSPITVSVQMGPNFTAVLETAISLNQAQLREFYKADATHIDYRMILIETKKGIVENASTVVTRNPKVTLLKLQEGVKYHATVHCTVPNSECRLTGEATFVYKYVAPKQPMVQPDHTEATLPDTQAPISVDNESYKMNVQVGEDEYLTCNFNNEDDLTQIAQSFINNNRLKPILLDGLVTALENLKLSGVTIRNVDVSDLL
uniref:Uncharacterized protein n=1 Tax=Babesia bovis TaxID=5865 RepID=S6BM57_BABBO|nr:hypothetical protein [Babesia bovis]